MRFVRGDRRRFVPFLMEIVLPVSYLGLVAFITNKSPQRLDQRLLRLVVSWWSPPRLTGGLFTLLAVVGLVVGYQATSVPVTLVVDGQPQHFETHQDTVAGLLREAGVRLRSEDLVAPALDSELAAGSVVQVRLARSLEIRTQHRRVADILDEAGVQVRPSDEILVDGQPWNLDADLPQAVLEKESQRGPGLASAPNRPAPVRIVLRRAVPVILTDDGVAVTFFTTHSTVGEALLAQDILLYLGDRVTPSLGSRVLPGMRIYIQRSTPVAIRADGHTLRTRTQHSTVGDVLAQEGIVLMGKDYSLPASDTPLSQDMAIRVVRVREALEIEQELIPFESQWVPDPDMRIDTQQLVQPGEAGVIKRRYRVTTEDGQEVANVMEDEWLDHPPSDKIVAYGTNVFVQTLETPDGPFEYWRHFRVLATSYSAATSGKSEDHPRYGVTRSGLPAGHGVIAVDPKVIPLMSQVYVPDYGQAVAGDTGGSIVGRHIDLGYDADPPLLYRWIDVYLATPMPPADQIRYVLPNWPQEPR